MAKTRRNWSSSRRSRKRRSNDNHNLPVLLAGGAFNNQGHIAFNNQGHIAFDKQNNTLLSNLYVRMLHHTGIESKSFGASTGMVSEI